MCGIAGVAGTPDRSMVAAMAEALVHRGPDGCGFADSGIGHVAATRLSIIDRAAGSDLIRNEAGSICIAFNGEIYNHRSLRSSLKSRGHTFATRTDTEVILHLYEDFGENCVEHLEGMFAFAILDGSRIFLARDRHGIKPVYYSWIEARRTFVFASEVKAILRLPGFVPHLDMQTFADFVVMSHPVGSRTFFEGVESLRPGHTMFVSWSDGEIRASEPKAYYHPTSSRRESVTLEEACDALEQGLTRAVESHLAADVPVGLTLSGGIDSTVLAMFAREVVDGDFFTFTVSDHEQHPDSLQAAAVSRIVGSAHRSVKLNFDDYLNAMPAFIAAEERPSRMYGLPFYLLCRQIAKHVRACMHGEGADELFGGYEDHLEPKLRTHHIALRLQLLKRLGIGPSEELSALLERLFAGGSEEDESRAAFEMNMADPLERHHLDPVDKCSMAFGIEMRVPYLDDGLVEIVSQFPLRLLVRRDLGVRKYLLRRMCLTRFGAPLLDVVLRGKMGVPSAGARLMKQMDELCDRVLPERYADRHPLGFCFERKRHLLAFELFEEIFLNHGGGTDAACEMAGFLNQRSGMTTSKFDLITAPQ